MKHAWATVAMILVATATTVWSQDEDDDERPAVAAQVAGVHTLTLGFAGLMDRTNRTDLDPINLTAGAMNSGVPSTMPVGSISWSSTRSTAARATIG